MTVETTIQEMFDHYPLLYSTRKECLDQLRSRDVIVEQVAWSDIGEGTWDPADADPWADGWWEYEPERMHSGKENCHGI